MTKYRYNYIYISNNLIKRRVLWCKIRTYNYL
jgi:hypothetical protein